MDIAKILFDNTTCRIFLDDKQLFLSEKRGVVPLLEVLDSNIDVAHATAYDRTIGKAAAFLYVLMRVSTVHCFVISKGGKAVFDKFHIAYTYQREVENIINRKGDDICPMEKATQNICEPQEALVAIRHKLCELQSK